MIEAILIYLAAVLVFALHFNHQNQKNDLGYVNVKPRARTMNEAARGKALDFASDVVTAPERLRGHRQRVAR